jgi:eukaryotic-like serine/threonine-protein kinase
MDPVRSIAVLPFADMSPGRTEDYLCAGIADEIINTLARVPGVRVAARTSAFRFNQTHDLREVGAALNVETVLEGSVRKAGSQLRVGAQLIDPVTGHQLWAARFDRAADDIFALQDEIAGAVRDVLTGASASATPAPAPDAAAYDLYLRGRHHLHKRTETGLYKALEHFRSAADRSGSFAASHAALAETFILLAVYGVRPPGDVMPRALEAANRALELNPTLAAAVACRAAVEALYEWRWRDADLEFRRAIEIDPLGAMARHSYAMNCLVPLGRFEEAEVHARQALVLDPLSFPVNAALGLLRYFAGAFDLAVPVFVKTIELEPSFGIAHMFLGLAYTEMGRFEDAIEETGAAMRLSTGSPEATAAHGYVLARAGREAEAADALASLEMLATTRYVSPALIAQVHAGRGDESAALGWLEAAVRVRAAELAWVDVRPVFDALRDRPEFHAIRRAIGFDNANVTQIRLES